MTKKQKERLDKIRNNNIVRIGKAFTRSVTLKKTYLENKEILYQYFAKHLNDYFSMFSLRIYFDVLEMLKDPTLRIDMSKIGDEDVIDLYDVGIINMAGNIDGKYKTLFKKAINTIKHHDDLAIMNTLLKGMIDLYGYLPLEDLYDLFVEKLESNITYRHFYNIVKHNSRLRIHCLSDGCGGILRFEAISLYQTQGEIVESGLEDFAYKTYDVNKYIRFADTFDLNGEFPFSNNELYGLKLIKRFSIIPNMKEDQYLRESFMVDKDTLKTISNYDKSYPKWAYKGHTLSEYEKFIYQTKYDISDDYNNYC